jgi:hypothetical protein
MFAHGALMQGYQVFTSLPSWLLTRIRLKRANVRARHADEFANVFVFVPALKQVTD